MTEFELRDATDADYPAIVALNAAEVQQTSAMDLARLQVLSGLAAYHRVVLLDGTVVAFLLAMREDAPYANENFAWFLERHSRFVYVDRIVVGAGFAGRKIGKRLYEDLFRYARSAGVGVVTCEYNVQPLNRASQRFHESFGFQEVGRRWAVPGSKEVSLQVAHV